MPYGLPDLPNIPGVKTPGLGDLINGAREAASDKATGDTTIKIDSKGGDEKVVELETKLQKMGFKLDHETPDGVITGVEANRLSQWINEKHPELKGKIIFDGGKVVFTKAGKEEMDKQAAAAPETPSHSSTALSVAADGKPIHVDFGEVSPLAKAIEAGMKKYIELDKNKPDGMVSFVEGKKLKEFIDKEFPDQQGGVKIEGGGITLTPAVQNTLGLKGAAR